VTKSEEVSIDAKYTM